MRPPTQRRKMQESGDGNLANSDSHLKTVEKRDDLLFHEAFCSLIIQHMKGAGRRNENKKHIAID